MSDIKRTVVFLSGGNLFLEFARECFKSDGHDFFDFTNWEDCRGQIDDLKPELIIVDFDSFSTQSFLESNFQGLPVVGFYSGALSSELESYSFKNLFKKPVDALELVSLCLE